MFTSAPADLAHGPDGGKGPELEAVHLESMSNLSEGHMPRAHVHDRHAGGDSTGDLALAHYDECGPLPVGSSPLSLWQPPWRCDCTVHCSRRACRPRRAPALSPRRRRPQQQAVSSPGAACCAAQQAQLGGSLWPSVQGLCGEVVSAPGSCVCCGAGGRASRRCCRRTQRPPSTAWKGATPRIAPSRRRIWTTMTPLIPLLTTAQRCLPPPPVCNLRLLALRLLARFRSPFVNTFPAPVYLCKAGNPPSFFRSNPHCWKQRKPMVPWALHALLLHS